MQQNSNELILNHPWYIYPHAFMSEYNNYDLYRSETNRLNKFIINLIEQIKFNCDNNIKSLISLQLGSAMEDALANFHTSQSNLFQYQQLYPNYINNFIICNSNSDAISETNLDANSDTNLNKKFVQIIIISPDEIFNKNNFLPFFTKLLPNKFVKINKYEYLCQYNNITIKINIFNCPFPHFDNRTTYISKYNYAIQHLQSNIYNINNFEPTVNDCIFIDNFYLNLDELFKNNPIIIINSWVSFKNLCSIRNNYNMFPELLKLANKYNIIATEWDYKDDCFFCKIVSSYYIQTHIQKFKNIIYISENLDNFDETILIKYNKIIKIFGLYYIDFDNNDNILLRKMQM